MEKIALTDIREAFEFYADPRNAAKMSTYMKGKFEFYGIKAPVRKDIQKDFYPFVKSMSMHEVFDLATELYKQPQREFHYFGMEMIDRKAKELDESHLEFLEVLVRTNSWWDTVDFMATHLFSKAVLSLNVDKQKEYVEKLAQHSDMWMNRVGIIYQLPHKHETNTELLELAIRPHITSQEFFHRKAIGWALRQYSKYDRQFVINFLERDTLSKLSIREASKYL